MKLATGRKHISKLEALSNPRRLTFQKDTSKWSRELRIKVYNKCKKDPIYWMREFGVVQHIVRGKIPFDLYPFQEDLVHTLFDSKNVIILKSRQMGISTLLASFATWLAIFYPDKRALVIATKGKTAKNFLTKAKLIYSYTPRWMKPKVTQWNQYNLSFKNDSEIIVSTTTADAGRSESVSLLVIDESAFVKGMDEIWTAIAPTISTGGKAVALSTPNGPSGWFYETAMAAKDAETISKDTTKQEKGNSQTNFSLVELPWFLHPERNKAWFEEMCKTFKYDQRKIAQELLCSFSASGNKVLDPNVLKWYRETDTRRKHALTSEQMKEFIPILVNANKQAIVEAYNMSPIEYMQFFNELQSNVLENLKIYELAENINDEVLMGIDTSGGGSNDYSAIYATTVFGKNVASFKGKLSTKLYACLIYLLGCYYNYAGLAIERNSGWGNDVIQRLTTELGYVNIFREDIIDLEQKKSKTPSKLGLLTSTKTRPFFLSKMIDYMSNISLQKRPIINDTRLLDELDTFVWAKTRKNSTKTKAQAQANCNDDLVLAFALVVAILSTEQYKDLPMGVFVGSPNAEQQDFTSELFKKENQPLINPEGTQDNIFDRGVTKNSLLKKNIQTYETLNPTNPKLEQMKEMWDLFGIPYGEEAKK